MKGIPAYTWNDYSVKTYDPYNKQKHIRNSFSTFCLHLPGILLPTRAHNKQHNFSSLGALTLVRQICRDDYNAI